MRPRRGIRTLLMVALMTAAVIDGSRQVDATNVFQLNSDSSIQFKYGAPNLYGDTPENRIFLPIIMGEDIEFYCPYPGTCFSDCDDDGHFECGPSRYFHCSGSSCCYGWRTVFYDDCNQDGTCECQTGGIGELGVCIEGSCEPYDPNYSFNIPPLIIPTDIFSRYMENP